MIGPFIVLGIRADATEREIRDRYLALVRKYPPALDPNRFQLVQRAYEAVRTPQARVETELFAAVRCGSFDQGIQDLERAATCRWKAPGLREILDAEE